MELSVDFLGQLVEPVRELPLVAPNPKFQEPSKKAPWFSDSCGERDLADASGPIDI
jgi:hypothetical protein